MSENESGDISQHPAVIWLRELLGQTDRGCIIVAHAFFDEEVGEVLRKHFQACGSKEKLCSELLGGENGGYAPLRGLLLRVKLAVALGLLDSDLLPIFDRLNTLRNQFAHRTRAKDLTKLHIESLLQTAQEPWKPALAHEIEMAGRESQYHKHHSEFRAIFLGIVMYLAKRLLFKPGEAHGPVS